MRFKITFGKFMLYFLGSHLSERGKISSHLRRHWARLVSKGVNKNANIHKGAMINGDGSNLVIEEHAAIGINCSVGSNTFIGKHTMMGEDCKIITQNHKFSQKDNKFVGYEYKNVYIGEYCWIGTNTIILPGAVIGDHCIVGAGSVVTGKKYPSYSLICGNPAVVKKDIRS